MTREFAYSVPAMHCVHCERAVKEELAAVDGVHSVDVDLDLKRVTVLGVALDGEQIRAAIAEAGYEVQ